MIGGAVSGPSRLPLQLRHEGVQQGGAALSQVYQDRQKVIWPVLLWAGVRLQGADTGLPLDQELREVH